VEAYLQGNLNEMETQELAKVYMSCHKADLKLSPAFRAQIETLLL